MLCGATMFRAELDDICVCALFPWPSPRSEGRTCSQGVLFPSGMRTVSGLLACLLPAGGQSSWVLPSSCAQPQWVLLLQGSLPLPALCQPCLGKKLCLNLTVWQTSQGRQSCWGLCPAAGGSKGLLVDLCWWPGAAPGGAPWGARAVVVSVRGEVLDGNPSTSLCTSEVSAKMTKWWC